MSDKIQNKIQNTAIKADSISWFVYSVIQLNKILNTLLQYNKNICITHSGLVVKSESRAVAGQAEIRNCWFPYIKCIFSIKFEKMQNVHRTQAMVVNVIFFRKNFSFVAIMHGILTTIHL